MQLGGGWRCEEIWDAKPAPFALAREGKAEKLSWVCHHLLCGDSRPRLSCRAVLGWVLDLVNNHIIPITLRRKISPDDFRFEQSAGNDLLFKLFLDRAILPLHQSGIVFLRRRFQLPLVLEQCRIVDIRKKLAQVIIFLYPHAPEWRSRNIGSIPDHRTTLRENWSCLFVNRYRLRVLL